MYARVKHYKQINKIAPWPANLIEPETMGFMDLPTGAPDKKGHAIIYNQAMRDHLRAINTPAAYAWLAAKDTMLFNSEPNTRVCESIDCSGNVVKLSPVGNNWWEVAACAEGHPPSLALNYYNTPEIIHKAVAVRPSDGKLYNIGKGYKGFFAIYKHTKLYIHASCVEFFPNQPTVTVKGSGLCGRSSPDVAVDNVVRYIAGGTKVQIVDYAPRGSSVWGLTDAGDYIALQYYPNALYYYESTDWHMATMAPLP
jgi:hypothetical protein